MSAPRLSLESGRAIVVPASASTRACPLVRGCTYEARTDAVDGVDVYAAAGGNASATTGAPFNRQAPLLFTADDDVSFFCSAGAVVFLRKVPT